MASTGSSSGHIDIEAKAMVSINMNSTAHHENAASSLGSAITAKLRTALRAAVPVVIMSLVLVGLVAFRFWATFPAIRDVAAG
jgi:hypothetical protein